MKTAVSVLQEMMVKLGKIPEYECVAQSGLQHQASFEYRCSVLGLAGGGTARSKKEAKQEAAASMLRQLAAAGHSVPAPYADPQPGGAGGAGCAGGGGGAAAGDARSYLALLKELCEDYRLPGPEYREVGEPTGPPHARRFEAEAAVGRHARRAASGTKRAARQLAAEALYRYLREHLRGTRDFVEETVVSEEEEKNSKTEDEATVFLKSMTRQFDEYDYFGLKLAVKIRKISDTKQRALLMNAVEQLILQSTKHEINASNVDDSGLSESETNVPPEYQIEESLSMSENNTNSIISAAMLTNNAQDISCSAPQVVSDLETLEIPSVEGLQLYETTLAV